MHKLRLQGCTIAATALFAAPAVAQPNVLILLADDIGVDNIGAYREGADPPPTPNIDALAASGVLFRNAWSNPWCSPTRACIQTGRYSFRTGVGQPISWTQPLLENQRVLPLAETTLPELLDRAQSGYAHAAIGKWHLGDQRNGGVLGPNLAGWSHYAGLLITASAYRRWPRTVNGVSAYETTYATTKTVDDALAWIGTAPEPWVCYVAPLAAHAPIHAPPSHLHTRHLPPQLSHSNQIPFWKAMVETLDTEIGRLLSSLDPGVRARTNVIFTSDNGTPAGVCEPPFLPSHAKGTPYEGGINVPLIVAGPIVQGAPREEAALVNSVDLFATVAEICGVSATVSGVTIDAVSFVPHLRDPAAPPVRAVVFAEEFTAGRFGTTGYAAIRDRDHKLILRFATQPPAEELYDLVQDPFEANNLLAGTLTPAADASYRDLKQRIALLRASP